MAYNFMGNDHSNEFATQEIADNKVVCVLSYLWILFWIPLVACSSSKYGKFHANQGLILLLTNIVLGIACGILGGIFSLIPYIGGVIAGLLSFVAWAGPFALMIYGMVNTAQGKSKELPLVGGLFTLIK